MIRIDIAGNKYFVSQQWREMTIAQGIALDAVVKHMPDNMKELYDDLHTGKRMEWTTVGIGVDDIYIEWPKWYGKVISTVCDVPDEVMERTLSDQRTMIYKTYLEQFVLGLVYMPYDFIPDDKMWFTFEGERYYLPFSGKDGMNKEIPGRWMDTVEFTESADLLMTSKKLEEGLTMVAPKLIAILCRPKGEKYDEATILARAEKFTALGMDIAWKVLFFSMDCIILLLNDMESYFREEMFEQAGQLLSPVSARLDGMARS